MIEKPLKLFIVVRLLSTFIIQTWFVPDEYWQATEVAHHIAFGYGYLTWEWQRGLRSVLYPAIFALLYKSLYTVGLDIPLLLIHLPRLVHALAFAFGDFFTWKLSKKLYGQDTAEWTSLCLLTSWFLEYCAPRTLSSCAEMILTSAALCYYPWRQQKDNCGSGYLWLVGASCIMRPTSGIMFFPLCLQHLWACTRKLLLLVKFAFSVVVVLCISIGLDSWYYGELVVVPWRFAQFNVMSGMAAHYGTHSWHWYLSQGLPVTLTVHIVPFILGMACHPKRHKELMPLCLWTVFVYSCLSHKEFRFLLPVLPLCLCIAGDYIAVSLLHKSKKKDILSKTRSYGIAVGLLVPNMVAVLYLGLVHQRGPLDTMEALQQEVKTHKAPDILFLMPCHSTPYFSHLHSNISMRFLTCEPNLKHEEDYIDEADVFEKDPMFWLQKEYKDLHINHLEKPQNIDMLSGEYGKEPQKIPTHVVLFDVLVSKISDFLHTNNYKLCWNIFHAHVEDGRRGCYIHIYCQTYV